MENLPTTTTSESTSVFPFENGWKRTQTLHSAHACLKFQESKLLYLETTLITHTKHRTDPNHLETFSLEMPY